MSPGESSREERVEEFGSGSSRISHSSDEPPLPPYYKSEMTLQEFIDAKHGDEKERDMYVTLVMIKVIERVEAEVSEGIYNSYSPQHIMLSNFSIRNFDRIRVTFIGEIRAQHAPEEGVYLAPEVLAGSIPTRRSPVYSLGTILDELIHGSTFFHTSADVQNLSRKYVMTQLNSKSAGTS